MLTDGTMTDLWPADIEHADDIAETPLGILKEQASLLGKRTRNIVIAEVRPKTSDDVDFSVDIEKPSQKREFAYEFNIVAPILKYQFGLFSISQNVTKLYPLTLTLNDSNLVHDIFPKKHSYPVKISINDIESFKEQLESIFNATSTKNLIKFLINQSNILNIKNENQGT